jgi:hypothetical protein
MAIDPNIALGFRPIEVANPLAQYGQVAQIQAAQNQNQVSQMQLDQMRRDDDTMKQIQAKSVEHGGPADINVIANAYMNSGNPKFVEFGVNLRQKLDDRAQFAKIMGMGGGAPAAPALEVSSNRVNEPNAAPGVEVFKVNERPAPVNNLAPTATPTAAPSVNALAAPPAGPDVAMLRQKRDMFLSMGTAQGNAAARTMDAEIALASRQQPETIREMQAFGLPITPEGFAKYTALKQAAPQPVELTRALADRDKLIGLGRPVNDPDVMAYTKLINKLTTHTPSAQQNVYAYTPASVQAQQDFVKAAADERKVLRNAPDTLVNIDAAKKLIPTAKTFMGKGGEPLLAAASFLNNRLGFGISTEGVTDATVLRTRLFEGILDNLKKLDSQPSQEQQRVLSEALGNLGTDPAALEQILNRIGETVRSRVDRFNTDVTDAETRGIKFPFTPQIKLPTPKLAPGAAAAQIPGQGPAPAPAIPPAAIDLLKSGKGTDAQFDAIFGAGAAKRAKGGN